MERCIQLLVKVRTTGIFRMHRRMTMTSIPIDMDRRRHGEYIYHRMHIHPILDRHHYLD